MYKKSTPSPSYGVLKKRFGKIDQNALTDTNFVFDKIVTGVRRPSKSTFNAQQFNVTYTKQTAPTENTSCILT